VEGVKRPCSLTWSMDLLTASARVLDEAGAAERDLVVLQIPAGSPGIERRPFWSTPVLAGAESDEVVLTDVYVPESWPSTPSRQAVSWIRCTRAASSGSSC
jgi:alkylation response protein AidB-like acyl-CoA dehydrogenase